MKRIILLCSLFLALVALDHTQAAPYTPKVGSPERVAICDSLRLHLAKNWSQGEIPKSQKIVFVIDWLKVSGDLAFFMGSPQFEKGGDEVYDYVYPIDYAFLLQRKSGKWEVIADFSGSDAPPPEYWAKMRKSLPKDVPAEIFSEYYRNNLGM